MKLPDLVEQKLRDPEAIVLPWTAPVRRGKMLIHYHCEGKLIGHLPVPRGSVRWLATLNGGECQRCSRWDEEEVRI